MNCGLCDDIMPFRIRVPRKGCVIFDVLGNSLQVSLDSHRGRQCMEEWTAWFWSRSFYEVGDKMLSTGYRLSNEAGALGET